MNALGWGDLPTWLSAIAALASFGVSAFAVIIARQSTKIARQQSDYARQQADAAALLNQRADEEKRATAICLAVEMLPELVGLEHRFRRFQDLASERDYLTEADPSELHRRWRMLWLEMPLNLNKPTMELRHLGPTSTIKMLRFRRTMSITNSMLASMMNEESFYDSSVADDFFARFLPWARGLGNSGLDASMALKELVAPLGWNQSNATETAQPDARAGSAEERQS